MKILLLTPKLNGHDGISMVSRTALTAIKQSGKTGVCEVRSLATESFTREQSVNGSFCRSASDSKPRYIGWSLQSVLSGLRFDLVIAMHIHVAPIAIPEAMTGSRLVIFLHGVEVWRPLTRFENLAIRRAAYLLANSRYTAERFKRINPQHRDREIQVCPLGIPAFQVPLDARDARYALIVGRMLSTERYKGHDLLLELWSEVQKHAPGFRLLVAGEGEDRRRLEQKAHSLGLQSKVEFLGLVDDQRLLELYQNCSFFVMPSAGEGFGLVFLEAMRARKACIAGSGAASEVVENGVSGLIVSSHSREELLGAVLQLICNPELARKMGRAGYDRFMRLFTADTFGARFTQALGIGEAVGVGKCAE